MQIFPTRHEKVVFVAIIAFSAGLTGGVWVSLGISAVAASWDWSDTIQSSAATGMLLVAIFALSSWKRQQRSQMITSLLDELTNTVHQFIQSLSGLTYELEIINIGFDANQYDVNLDKTLKYPALVRFIEKDGSYHASRMETGLETCRQATNRINSLLQKGQILEIDNFNQCIKACKNITWQMDRINAVYRMINRTGWNWSNPKVEALLGQVSKITPGSIKTYMDTNELIFAEFMQQAYRKQYRT